MITRLASIVGLVLLSIAPIAWGQLAKPLAPSQTVPELRSSGVTILCVNCDKPFDSAGHKEAMKSLTNNVFAAELRRALFYQDSVHQFESKAHFDNCDFDAATAYIDSLLDEADAHVKAANAARSKNDRAEMQVASKKAFFAIGQALHAVQDFYSHTDYIERSVAAVKSAIDIPVVATWTEKGKALLKKLRQEGLVSGFVFWGFPQRCAAGTKSHSELAKDSEQSVSGKVRIPHLDNLSQYRLALITARQASTEFLSYAFKRWPLLGELNGKYLAFEILVDRRGL
jgi:hypothetical protein